MLDTTQFLNEIRNRDPHLGKLLEHLIDSIDVFSKHAGFDPTGRVAPPPAIQAVNVAAGSDHVHVTLTHNSPIKKNIQYFVEWSANDPSFGHPNVEHLGASRGRVLALPAKDGTGAAINYYFKAYSQYQGSNAQTKHTYFGTQFAPTAVTLTGASQLTLLASTGSGTGKSDGSQSGSGIGTVLARPAISPVP
jgi:hypothetical protein